MNKIQKSLNQVLPTEQEKAKMLNNIFNKKRPNLFIKLVPIIAVFVFCIILTNMGNDNNVISPMSLRQITINYNNKEYCEDGTWKGFKNKLEEIEESILPGVKVYKIKNSETLVVYENNIYKKYNICRGE